MLFRLRFLRPSIRFGYHGARSANLKTLSGPAIPDIEADRAAVINRHSLPKILNARILNFLHPGAFRLFLAIAVLVCHSSRFDLGDWAVNVFFILSGYWIYRMWTQKYSKARAPLLVFICSRLTRILPLFWLANILSASVAVAIDPGFPRALGWGLFHAVASNLFLLGYSNLPHSQGALWVAWSLDIEMQFYLVFPFALSLCLQSRTGMLWKCLVGAVCIGGFVLFLLPAEAVSHNLSCFGLFFLVGAASAHCNWRPSENIAAGSLIMTGVIVAICWAIPDWRHLFENGRHGATIADLHGKRIAQAALAFFSAPVAIFSVRSQSDGVDRALGELTYVIYLIHWPIMMLHTYFFQRLSPFQRLPSILAAWCVVAVASMAVFRYFDQPIEKMRKRWVASRVAA